MYSSNNEVFVFFFLIKGKVISSHRYVVQRIPNWYFCIKI